MNEFRIRPKDGYIQEANWSQLYVLTEYWKSDLEFYMLDLEFLQHIIDKYFMWMINKKDIDNVREIESILVDTARSCGQLKKKTVQHLKHLNNLIDASSKYDSKTFRDEHEQLENEISAFVKLFRKSRKDVFHITKQVMDSETFKDWLK